MTLNPVMSQSSYAFHIKNTNKGRHGVTLGFSGWPKTICLHFYQLLKAPLLIIKQGATPPWGFTITIHPHINMIKPRWSWRWNYSLVAKLTSRVSILHCFISEHHSRDMSIITLILRLPWCGRLETYTPTMWFSVSSMKHILYGIL